MQLMTIASGSSGNSIYIGDDNTHLLIDAGISGKRIECGLNSVGLSAKDISGILVTHEHVDHISGIGVLARRHGIPIYATQPTIAAICSKNLGKIDKDLFNPIEPSKKFTVGDLEIDPIPISHDAACPVAYKATDGKGTVGVMTDLGVYNQMIVDKLKDINVLLLEANHDVNMLNCGPYPYHLKQRILSASGHLSNEISGQLLGKVLSDGVKHILLGHLSKENNYPGLALETVKLEITQGDNPYKGTDFPIEVASREVPSKLIYTD